MLWQTSFNLPSIKDAKSLAGEEPMDRNAVADVLESNKHDVKFVFIPARKKHLGKNIGLGDIEEAVDLKPAAKKGILKHIPFSKFRRIWLLSLEALYVL